MTNKHTALPWVAVTDFDGRHGHFPIMADWSYNDDDEPHHPKIASVSSTRMGVPADIAKANADFIVRAVNSHYALTEQRDELLAALKSIVKNSPFTPVPFGLRAEISFEQIKAAQAAIAKAEAAE
jgi:hypothetical protein